MRTVVCIIALLLAPGSAIGLSMVGGRQRAAVKATMWESSKKVASKALEVDKSTPADDRSVESIMASMTLAEKAAQMLQVEVNAHGADIFLPFVGSVLFNGNAEIGNNKKEDWQEYAQNLQKQAMAGPLKIPLFIGSDSVHGNSHLKETTIFPHNILLGCTHNETLVREIGRATAIETAAAGINYMFAPCLDVVQDVRWGRTYESFGQSPDLVSKLGAALVEGAQSVDTGMITSAKHFVAAGGVQYGTGRFRVQPKDQHKKDIADVKPQPLDRGDAAVSKQELLKHLIPYNGAIAAGAGSIMASYSSVNGVLNHANKELLGHLKDSEGMDFHGFVITDYAGVDMVDPDFDVALPAAINAGVDMVMLPGTAFGCRPWSQAEKCPTADSFVRDIIKHQQTGKISMARIDDAVRRILTAKKAHHIFAKPMAPQNWFQKVGCAQHRQLAREAAQQGTVVLKNKEKTLPFSSSKHGRSKTVCVAGSAGNNLGMQLGGWSVKWQGFSGNDMTTGTTFWDAVNKRLPGSVYDESGKCENFHTVFAVVGEMPYAEGYGDTSNLEISNLDQAMLKNAVLKVSGKEREVILVFMGGRPLFIDEAIKGVDAMVAAFVPGVEGGNGVLDVILGEKAPTGKLSVTWPKSTANLPVTETSPSKDVQFAVGFGLTYDKH